ncbi:threonine synthase [Thermohalobacter berrensis]|uniref:Threonine synthase n=1 Tax=Thermohalobacter berrensis TaxID=99594 RepID=A0A419SUK5_9FIRM|nr:threonine synthase [Thermohalobacter berrensis]
MYYESTRGGVRKITSSEAIVKGIADDGGLYVPEIFPKLDIPLENLLNKDYRELALYILKKYLSDFNDNELIRCVNNAYDEKFQKKEIVPLVEKDNLHFLELYHGPTLAFKDMALSILPYFIKEAMRKLNINKEVVILTATSGDTGKAALEGFANVEGTKIIVFYPKDGVSKIQERQMITQKGKNTFVIGIEGNFDDAQRGVKEIFKDREFNKKLQENNYTFSSANSINIGRLIPQIVYYVYAYLKLLRDSKISKGEKINIVVPTGNFGNILAAFYAKNMGLPINKLICASNENNVLYDFFKTGVYNSNRKLILTSSPSMDILISSNLERLLFEISGRDAELIKDLMEKLKSEGEFKIPRKMKDKLKNFYGEYATEEETYRAIKEVYQLTGYVIDTHTAVAYSVYTKYKRNTLDNTKTVIASTASPFKFTRSVYEALNGDNNNFTDFQLIDKLSKYTNLKTPKAIEDIKNREVIHRRVCKKNEMKKVVEKILLG